MAYRKKGGGAWKESVKHAVAVPSLPIIGHALRNDLQTAPRDLGLKFDSINLGWFILNWANFAIVGQFNEYLTHNIFSISHKLVKLAPSQERKVKSFCEWKIWRFSRSFESRVTLNLKLLAQTQRYSSRTFKKTFIRLKRMGFKTTKRPSSKVIIFLKTYYKEISKVL